MKTNQWEEQSLFIQSLLYSMGPTLILCLLEETARQAEEWEALQWEEAGASNVPRLDAIGLRKLEVGSPEIGHLTSLVNIWCHPWLSLVDPKLETGVEIREAASN